MSKDPVTKNVPIDKVHGIPDESELRAVQRGTFDDFCAQLARERLMVPIIVRPHPTIPGEYELADGRHRAAAYRRNAQNGGRKTIRAEISELTDLDMRVVQVAANVQRTDYTPYEEAIDLKLLVDAAAAAGEKITQAQLAQRIGKMQSHVSKRLQLLELPEAIANRVGTKLNIKDAMWWKPLLADAELVQVLNDHLTNAEIPDHLWRRAYFDDILHDALKPHAETIIDAFSQVQLRKITGLSYYDATSVVQDKAYRTAIRKAGALTLDAVESYCAPLAITRDLDMVRDQVQKAQARFERKRIKAQEEAKAKEAAFLETEEGQRAKEQAEQRAAENAERAAKSQLERKAHAAAKDRQLEAVGGLTRRDITLEDLVPVLVERAIKSRYTAGKGCIEGAAEQAIVRDILGEYAPAKLTRNGDSKLFLDLWSKDPARALRYAAAILFFDERQPAGWYQNTVQLVNGRVSQLATGKTAEEYLKQAHADLKVTAAAPEAS